LNIESIKLERKQQLMDDIASYLKSIPAEQAAALTIFRERLAALLPAHTEKLSRGVPFFYYRGKRALGYRASKGHLSFFIMEGTVLQSFAAELKNWEHGPTVVRFQPKQPIPLDLLARLVAARLAEIDAQMARKS
jgi:uncharacterized protein YdhG (YjbR/CyaY superfamily)